MSNNMDLGYEMFCYQCEQTANGKGCTKLGVCGKTAEVANLQDLLIFQIKGISCYGKALLAQGKEIDKSVIRFIENVLFTTLTNVNFDAAVHVELLKESQEIKDTLKGMTGEIDNHTAHVTYTLPETKTEMLKDAPMAGIMYEDLDPDIRSLRQTVLYGLKGISAYGHQARELGYYSDEVDNFYIEALEAITDDTLTVEELIRLTMRTGEMAIAVMQKLDEANTEVYGNPSPHTVDVHMKKGPFIVVSGHDLKDLEMLLEQTKDKGINVYTHGEMLPAHAYPLLKQYPHLKGNFGTAWQNQQKEFDGVPAPILYTTNCLMPVKESYRDRVFTTEVVSYPQMVHIGADKDFTPVIEKALELGGYKEDTEFTGINGGKEVMTGFAHGTVLSVADQVVDAVKSGAIRHFFLVGGCDGARPGRNYYTEFVKQTPKDSVILTLACGKYRFNDLDLGEISGLPRLMDMGQCNDAYSAIKVAVALAEAFGCSVNELPLSMVLSWYEQKAVCILLTLLHLGIQNIKLGPTLPAFISPNVLAYLVEHYHIAPITTPEADLKEILGA